MSPAAATPAPALPNGDTGADGWHRTGPCGRPRLAGDAPNQPNKNAEAHLAFPERKV